MQAAIDAQSPMALSHGLAACGQQSSIGSEADISVISCDLNLNAAMLAAGSNATESAIRRANMVRAKAMLEYPQYPPTGRYRSSDGFVRNRTGKMPAKA